MRSVLCTLYNALLFLNLLLCVYLLTDAATPPKTAQLRLCLLDKRYLVCNFLPIHTGMPVFGTERKKCFRCNYV